MVRILVIEDQEAPWENYMLILGQICKIVKADVDRARWYTEAEKMVESDQYDIIFLDHRMPQDDPGCTDVSDFDRFRDQLQNIGYGLLTLIQHKQPNAVVVGTSSLSRGEIGRYSSPERRLDKTNMFDELPELLNSVLTNEQYSNAENLKRG